MKAAFAVLVTVLAAHAAQAANVPIARCYSTKHNVGLCVTQQELPQYQWKSIEVRWTERDAGCTFEMNDRIKVRQFTQGEIKRDDEKKLVTFQKNVFLFWGQKTEFNLDRKAGTAVLRGKNKSCLDIGDGCRGQPEPSGRWKIEFDRCELL